MLQMCYIRFTRQGNSLISFNWRVGRTFGRTHRESGHFASTTRPKLYHAEARRWHDTVISWTKKPVLAKAHGQRISRTYIGHTGASFRFDTHKLVKKLQEDGFTLEQAESVTNALSQVMDTSLQKVTMDTVSKLDKERLEMKMKNSLDEMKHEMFLLERIKFVGVQENTEKLKGEVTSLKDMLRHEVSSLKAGVALDFSLEKSRVKEEMAERDQKIKDTNNRIETEIAKLGTQLEAQKLDLIKYLVGSVLSCFTLLLAVWRFLKM